MKRGGDGERGRKDEGESESRRERGAVGEDVDSLKG